MQMDDTLVFASSRRSFEKKLSIGKTHSDQLDQAMHPVKSKFFTVNVPPELLRPVNLGGVVISHTMKYVYLGTILSNSTISEQARDHIDSKSGSKWKFFSYLDKNRNAPYPVKEKVWSSALTASIYYSCDTWLGCDKRILSGPYLQTLKSLLSVRETTCTDVVYTEAGVPSAETYVVSRQQSFLKRLYDRQDFFNSYIGWAVQEAIRVRSTMGKAISKLTGDTLTRDTHTDAVSMSNSSRRMSYRDINPDLTRHLIYSTPSVPEFSRVSFTRLRLGSHYLRVETGRWARLPRHQRVCRCDKSSVQDETHILFHCPLTAAVRAKYPEFTNIINCYELYKQDNIIRIAMFCHECLRVATEK